MADGLDFDESDILWKGSLQEIETGAVLLVGRLHTDKWLRHTPKKRQTEPNFTRSPRDLPVI